MRITISFLMLFVAFLANGQLYDVDPQDLQKYHGEQNNMTAMIVDTNLSTRDASCPEESFLGNLPTGEGAYTSSQDAEVTNYQSFSGIGEPIGEFTMWAIQAFYESSWTPCYSSTMEFDIVFYKDNNGLPGDVVHSETQILQAIPDPDVDFGTFTVVKLHAILENPVSINAGWFSVESKNSPTCWSLFVNSPDGQGQSGYYDTEDGWTVRPAPVSFCLLPPIADPGAPAAPTNFTAEAGAMGALTAELSFILPSETVSGDPLTELTNLKIYRNGELHHTISEPVIGAEQVYNDVEFTESGWYYYLIAGENSMGEGLTASTTVFVGPDVPAAPGNVELVAVGNSGQLSWDAPTGGLNGGYFSEAGVTYTLVRFPGAVEVATDISDTEFFDDGIPAMDIYYYTITPSNDVGVGGTATSPTALLGTEGIVDVSVGTDQTIPSFRSPFDLWYNNSLAQTIYYPDELGEIGGILMGVSYYNNFTSNLPGEEVRIYAGVTEAEDMADGFLPGDAFSLVFQGEVDFPDGENEVIIIFDDPFIYTGGNLVLMTNKMNYPHTGDIGDRFYNTFTPDREARQRITVSDQDVFDPLVPPATGANQNWVPNTTFLFMGEGVGSLQGTVVDTEANPLENVLVTIEGTSITTTTNAVGEFEFPYLFAGEHELTATKVGYSDVTETFTISEDEVTSLSMEMTALNTITVSGFVASDNDPSVGIEGAVVQLTEYGDFETTTDNNGNFIIEDVFVNHTYTIHVTAETHQPYMAEVDVGETDLVLDDIILEFITVVEVLIGDGNRGMYIPFNMLAPYSLAQTIYYPDEIGLSNGVISALQYYNSFDTPFNDREIKIWIGETEYDNLLHGWIDPGTLELVYDGTIDFPEGQSQVFIELQNLYMYNGGNLVIYTMRTDVESSGGKTFFGTRHTDSERSRRAQTDSEPYDPLNPPDYHSFSVDDFPNITLVMHAGGVSFLKGVVTNGVEPLEGVQVKVLETASSAYTNEDGFYELPIIETGTFDIEFRLAGYTTLVLEDVVIESDEEIILDATLDPVPQHGVFGTVIGNDGLPIEGAAINLEGFVDYSTTSDENGEFLIEDVYADTYTFTVAAEGYEMYVNENLVVDEDLDLGEITLVEILLAPAGLRVDVDGQEEGNALFSWGLYQEREFRWDDGMVIGQLGSEDGTLNSVLGSVHRNDALLYEMSWYLTDNGGPHNTVKVWVFGLDDNGNPNPNDVLYEQTDVPNVDLQWNTYEFSTPVEAPNGFLVGVSYNGFLAIGIDDGLGDWPFQPNTHFFSSNVTNEAFHPIETLGDFQYNFLIRAVGLDLGDLEFNDGAMAETTSFGNFEGSLLSEPVKTGFPLYQKHDSLQAEKVFVGYNVFLNDMDAPLATEITDTEFLFTDLASGSHIAGVQSVYTSGASDITTIDFSVELSHSVTFIVEDKDGNAITDAIITFDGDTFDAGVYEFFNLSPGTYAYTVSKDDYANASGEVTVVDEDVVETVMLGDAIYYNVTFRVHFHDYEEFDPENDVVYITGDMTDWVAPGDDHENQVMEPTNEDPMIYQITHNLPTGTHNYKYFLNAGWQGVEWVGDPNRVIEVNAEMTVDNVFGDPNDPVNVPELEAGSLLVFPNPATNKLNIVASEAIHHVRLIDILGQELYSTTNLNTDSHVINVAGLREGIYLIQVLTSKGISTHRVLVTH